MYNRTNSQCGKLGIKYSKLNVKKKKKKAKT